MDEIFNLVREGNSYMVKSWIDCTENDFNLVDDHGFSLLHWACWDGHLNNVEVLVNKGAKINCVNKCEDTPLHNACQNNHLNVALYLIKNKANINAVNIHGNTPLHYACHFGYHDLTIELIRYNAHLGLCNRFNQTAIDLCQDELRQTILEMVKQLSLELTRIPYRQESISRYSRQKSKEIPFAIQSTINIDELPVEKMINSNHSSTIWKGYWQGSEVVIKLLKIKESTQKIASIFNQESKRLRIFNSVNILPVLGTCVCLPDLIIVSQYFNYGSLYSTLHENNNLDFEYSYNVALNLAIGIAKGMEFLHSLESGINFDLNSKCIVLDDDLTPKLNMSECKFSFIEKYKIYNPAWIAPEILQKKPKECNKKMADMWSFGVVLWELFTRSIPFGNLTAMQCGIMIAKNNLRLELSNEIPNHVKKLIKICTNEEANRRPKFEMIIPILEKMAK